MSENLLKPFDYFFNKKQKKSENAKLNISIMKSEWCRLSDKKMLKYIKKAEKNYDKIESEDGSKVRQPLYELLDKRERYLLFKSYGLPEKPASNSKYHFINKYIQEKGVNFQNNSSEEKKLKEEAEQEWGKLPQAAKNEMVKEYQAHLVDYNRALFDFSRNLTENRANDYRKSLELALNTPKSNEKSHAKIALKESRFSNPLQIYIRKCLDENPSLKVQEIKNKFYKLNKKKRLKMVKFAEKLYDSIATVYKLIRNKLCNVKHFVFDF
jgi:hypothetical protein